MCAVAAPRPEPANPRWLLESSTAGWLGWNKGTFVSPSWPSGCQPLGEVVGNLKASFI